jgi:hypothetical protein
MHYVQIGKTTEFYESSDEPAPLLADILSNPEGLRDVN